MKTIDEADFSLLMEFYDHPDFFFVQIGANDGITDDALRSLVLAYGWRGLLVEPLPDVFERLQQNYSSQIGLRFANVAIAKENGPVRFLRHPRHPQCSGLGRRTRRQRRSAMEEVEVLGMTFPRLLQEHSIDQIDLLQIDVEGFDAEVIRSIPFDRVVPRLIRYEHKHLGSDRTDLESFLGVLGYELLYEANDTVAVLR